jgi:hypothetical protein
MCQVKLDVWVGKLGQAIEKMRKTSRGQGRKRKDLLYFRDSLGTESTAASRASSFYHNDASSVITEEGRSLLSSHS